MALLCLDYISVGQKEITKPLFNSTDVKEMVKHTVCLNYEEVTDITPDVRLTFYNAGHTLGSSMAHLHIGNGLHNMLYTGDMNYETSNLLAAAVTRFPRLETLIMESTYGGKDDNPPSRKECEKVLLELICSTYWSALATPVQVKVTAVGSLTTVPVAGVTGVGAARAVAGPPEALDTVAFSFQVGTTSVPVVSTPSRLRTL